LKVVYKLYSTSYRTSEGNEKNFKNKKN